LKREMWGGRRKKRKKCEYTKLSLFFAFFLKKILLFDGEKGEREK